MSADLFQFGQLKQRLDFLRCTAEWDLIQNAVNACLRELPTEVVWRWADREVWLDEKMTAEPGQYNSAKTPWAREWQEIPLRPETREVAIMKSSRSGASEAAFNILRWMPKHWPGNAGVAFPDDKQARDVAKRRILDSVKKHAEAQLSGDKDDATLSNIHLLNMVIKVGPSGSPRLFTEWWVRYFILDEIEEHDTDDTTSTYDRALSRQTDVADALLFAISKPKKAGGIIDWAYTRGTQKQWNTPCPRCERNIVLSRHCFQNEADCRKADGTWDLEMVVNGGTFALCPLCGGRIVEGEKRIMNDAGLWIPTEMEHRRRDSDGKAVPPVPGVESYHISDYVSYHPKVTWGLLRAMALMAYEIQPTRKAQVHYLNNHEGVPEERQVITTDSKTIQSLVAGIVETRKIKAADGSEIEQNIVLGLPDGYLLAYKQGRMNARLPYLPDVLLLFADKQKDRLKYLVFAVRVDPLLPGQCEAHLVDMGSEDDETQLKENVIKRKYFVVGSEEPVMIGGGFIDSRYRGQAVYALCLDCYHELGVQIWPVRGEGEKDKRERGSSEGDSRQTRDSLRGRIVRQMEDWCEKGKLMVRYFKDHPLKTMFYADKLQKRMGWRIWLPKDYPAELASEWTAETYDEVEDVWEHNQAKSGPNDFGDCGKYLVLWMLEHLPMLLQMKGAEIAPEPEEKPEETEGQKERDYILRRRVAELTKPKETTDDGSSADAQ